MSVQPGQSIAKVDLDRLAALANVKLTLKKECGYAIGGEIIYAFYKKPWQTTKVWQPINGWTGDSWGDYSKFFGASVSADFRSQNRDFAFGNDYKMELLRIRVNLRDQINAGETVTPAARQVSGPWPKTKDVNIGVRGLLVADGYSTMYETVDYYSPSLVSVFTVTTKNRITSSVETYDLTPTVTQVRCIGGTCYQHTVTIQQLSGFYQVLSCSDESGVFYVRTFMHTPEMNPLSSATPWKPNTNERISRFATIVHRALNPFTELPAPYPPAELVYSQQGDLSGGSALESITDYYTGNADYNYGFGTDPEQPHSPRRSSYFRTPSYPVRNIADGEWQPFAEKAISVFDFGQVISGGVIYSVTVSRKETTTTAQVQIGTISSGQLRTMRTVTLNAGERSNTFYPSAWFVFADSPIYYTASETVNVSAQFVAKSGINSGLIGDIGWPIHSCYYNDTEALLNLL